MSDMRRFKNRMQAGRLLAEQLLAYFGRRDAIVLALPRGGVPVGFAIAKTLEVSLDVLVVRKLGVPGHEEYAMGAVASGGMCVLHQDALRRLQIPRPVVETVLERESLELQRREKLYRAGRPELRLHEHIVILVDDGIATGATMRAAIDAIRQTNPSRIVAAVPVAPAETCKELAAQADEVICLIAPDVFYSVGMWYHDFDQTSDDEVSRLLTEAAGVPATHDSS